MLCSDSVSVFYSGEIKIVWSGKCVGKLRWSVYDFSGAWNSRLEC